MEESRPDAKVHVLEVSVSVTCQLTTVTACIRRSYSVLLILLVSISESDSLVEQSFGLKSYILLNLRKCIQESGIN